MMPAEKQSWSASSVFEYPVGVSSSAKDKPPPARLKAEAPRSIARVLQVLDAASRYPAGSSLTDLAVELGMPKSSLLVLLKALVSTNHLMLLNARYRLGGAAYDLAQTILSARPGNSILSDALHELRERTQETAILIAMDAQAGVVSYIDARESPLTVRYTVMLGTTRPLYCTAAGQATLAFQSEDYRRDYFAKAKLRPLTPSTIIDPAAIQRNLETIRKVGYAVSIGEGVPGSVGICAPLDSGNGRVDRALLVAGPIDRLEPQVAEVAATLLEVARKTSSMLRYVPRKGVAP